LGLLRAAGWVEGPGGGEERFDSFVAENDEGGDRPETVGERFVAAGLADAANDVLTARLFQIIAAWRGPTVPGGRCREPAPERGDRRR